MLKGLLTFGLTRRPLVLLGLLVFIGAGLFAFSKLNIEAYPNPAPVILEITAQAAGPVGRGDGALLHDPDGSRPSRHAGGRRHSLDLVLRPVLRPRHLSIRRRLLLRAHADRDQPAAKRQPAEQRHAANPGHQPGRRNLSLPGGRAAAFRLDQSAHRPGLDIAAAAADRSRASSRSTPGAARPRNSTSRSICTSSMPTTSRCRR